MNKSNKYFNFISFLKALPPFQRSLVLAISDVLFIITGTFLCCWYTLPDLESLNDYSFFQFIIIVSCLGSIIYTLSGQYKGLTRYIGSTVIYRLSLRNLILVILSASISNSLYLITFPIKSAILLWIMLTALVGMFRFTLRDLITRSSVLNSKITTISAIYGAGIAGGQLFAALRVTNTHVVKYFFDDNPDLWGRNINGIKILPSTEIEKLVAKGLLNNVLIAIPSLPLIKRRRIVANLKRFKVKVSQIPSLDNITRGVEKISSLKSINIEDLLGRDSVPPDINLLSQEITSQNVCVIGAGGSIGSELCQQIVKLEPKTVLLIEINELALYNISEILEEKVTSYSQTIVPVLGSATDTSLLDRVFAKYNIDIIFHAAAYKHVPIVEMNPLQGIYNNVFSTLFICRSALKNSVKKVLLISTDKAVRPTNIMGASKRIAELVMQSFSNKNSRSPSNVIDSDTCFSMVRFGNVLNSSGSVVPLFKKQINQGGPVTITHPDINRYFMTIKEAAQLVLQSSSLALGGEVFLLDMGTPVLITELAKQMINLSGLTVKDKENPEGDIEIIFSGLRPGEKLYEELLIDGKAQPTLHKLIYKSLERSIESEQLLSLLSDLELAIKDQDQKQVFDIVSILVPELSNISLDKML